MCRAHVPSYRETRNEDDAGHHTVLGEQVDVVPGDPARAMLGLGWDRFIYGE
jgi:hypothetical protein